MHTLKRIAQALETLSSFVINFSFGLKKKSQ